MLFVVIDVEYSTDQYNPAKFDVVGVNGRNEHPDRTKTFSVPNDVSRSECGLDGARFLRT